MAHPGHMKGWTVASALAHRATSDPQKTFLLSEGVSITYGELDSLSESLAASLAELGIEAGDRVAVLLPPRSEFVIAMFAAAKLGAVIVPLNPRLTPSDLQYMLRHSEAVAAVTIETWDGVDYLHRFEELFPQLPELQYLITVGEEDLWYDDRIFQFEDLISAGAGRDFSAPEVDPDEDVFGIVYTSGTTGKPKGVSLTHTNILLAASGTVEAAELTSDDRVIGVTALFHVFGFGPGILGTLFAGASLVLAEDLDIWFEGDPWRTLELIEDFGVTVHYGVPTLFVRALQVLDRDPRELSTLRLAVVAGAPASPGLLQEIEERLCPVALVAYSLTETASTVSMTRSDDDEETRRTTVGRALPGIEIRVVGPEGGELDPGEVGEILLRGGQVMKGYYRQPNETESAFDEEGFFRTGDLGRVDAEGILHLVGRSKDVIIRGGFNVYPREVESRLLAHPAVFDGVVVGVPDPVLGEAICACVVPEEGAIVTEAEIRGWCEASLPDFKVPDLVRFVEWIPRTDAGKVRRAELVQVVDAPGATTPDPTIP